MSIFQEIVLEWAGQEFRIAPDKVMGAIATVEEVVTLKEIGDYAQTGNASMSKLAMAYGAVLRYAGATVRDDEVYAGLFKGDVKSSPMASISNLLMMMIPPAVVQTQGKQEAEPTVGKSSSKKPTK
jgi:hypothetical protein